MNNRLLAAEQVLLRHHREKLFGCCTVAIATADETPTPLGIGTDDGSPDGVPLSPDHLFDAASLTKSVATSALALLALQEQRTALDEPIAERLPELRTPFRERVQLKHLLTHTLDYRISLSSLKELPPDRILDRILTHPFEHPPGKSYLYCNGTSLVLGLWLERLFEERLDRLATEKIFLPLGMNSATFAPREIRSDDRIVPTEIDRWRGGEVRGEVHDESAWALLPFGPVGSAGLFLTIGDLQRWVREWLRAVRGEGTLFSRETAEKVREISSERFGEISALGFERNQPAWMGRNSTADRIGKTGFTGCSLVIDFARGRGVALLSNSTWPKRKPREVIDRFRAEIADFTLDR